MAATGGHTLVICHQDEVSELERRKWLCLQCQVISSQSTGTTGPRSGFLQARLGEPGSSASSRVSFIFSLPHAALRHRKDINIPRREKTSLPDCLTACELCTVVYIKCPEAPGGVFCSQRQKMFSFLFHSRQVFHSFSFFLTSYNIVFNFTIDTYSSAV